MSTIVESNESIHASALILRVALRRIRTAFESGLIGWRQRQRAHAIYKALSALDSRTLHDLGFERSEIASVAAEASGGVERTRLHARI